MRFWRPEIDASCILEICTVHRYIGNLNEVIFKIHSNYIRGVSGIQEELPSLLEMQCKPFKNKVIDVHIISYYLLVHQ